MGDIQGAVPVTARDPFVSIVIPARNEERYIARCLAAIGSCDYDPQRYEVIVVDNGSTDNTAAIAEQLGCRVCRRPGLTISELRNCGAALASGEILAFLDADVMVTPAWLRNGVLALEEEGVGCAGSSPEIPDGATWVEQVWHLQVAARPDRCDRDWLASMNIFIRRDCFAAVGGFDPRLRTCEDVDLGYRLRRICRIVSDRRIGAVHLGEAKTLVQLFRKESWRGIGNFRGLLCHGMVWKEIPSHAVALNYFLLLPLLPLLPLQLVPVPTPFLLAALLLFPVYKALTASGKQDRYARFASLLLVWLVYGLARGWSVWRVLLVDHER